MKTSVISFLAIFLFSCASVKQTAGNQSEFPLEKMAFERSNSIVSLKGDGSIAVSLGSEHQTAQFRLALFKTDSLMMTIYGPFGVALGKLQSTSDLLQFYDAFNQQIYEGAPSQDNFQRVVRIPLSYNTISHLLRGEIPGGLAKFELISTNENQTFGRETDSTLERVIYSPEKKAILDYSKKMKAGATIISTQYSDFITSNGVSIAKKIVTHFPGQDGSIILEFHTVETNISGERYSFNLPNGVKRSRF